ncbi:TIM barrel protein [Halosimplex litoreum]|uniref:TIM barrel protein n=1 Tax=Halosimplex litoreum TaxID=1198301 RepID=A0A7T3FY97_9EURY|nr:TIM barrel protein [Halosimplex litoreum]QPV62797.1 TIM barrel protein [Halosimplex litoreum]
MVEFAANAGIVAADGETVADGIERAADLGVDAVEFFDWESADRDAVRAAAEEHGVEIAGILAAGAGSNIDDRDAPATVNPYDRETAVADVERSLDAAAAFDAECLIVTVGPDQGGFARDTQRRALERVLADVAPAAEEADVTVVVEPLNTVVDHPGYFLESSREAFDITRSVGGDHVKVLFDAYHQQITEGDVIRTLTGNVDQVGHVHVADNPGRLEPGSGEMAYDTIFDALDEAGYAGYVGMEFFATSEGTSLADGIRGTMELD